MPVAHKVEGQERGLSAAALGHERAEIAPAAGHERDPSPSIEATHRLGDRRKPIGEVSAAPAPDLHLLAGEDAEAVVLDLVRPAGSGGR
jgi:hypothetical protein